MLVLVVHNQVKTGQEDFVLEQFRRLEAASRQEPGCLLYVVQRGKENPSEFLVYEQYRDEAALQSHRQSAHFLEFGPKIKEACESQQRALYDPITETAQVMPDLIAD
jgi:(4S)-4-hydroxy-5-phosphonooxypentane-2,3-dione isomerase